MQLAKKNRNHFVDIMRGIAMLLVVLGHTITGCTIGSHQTFLFNVIWSLQMPLFILISGYVTKYSYEIKDISSLWSYIKRRTIAYVLPWIVWSFIVRGIVFNQSDFFNIKYILWHMDAGYWFLATIWTISMIFGISSFISSRFIKSSRLMKQGILLATYLACMALLGIIAFYEGLSFFAIKLTLYYLPFYYIGYLYGQCDDKLLCNERNKKILDGIIAIAFTIWIFVSVNYSLYGMSDRGIDVLIRAITSLSGCIAVCGLCYGIFSEKIGGVLATVGVYSLEIYLTHYLLLNTIKYIPKTVLMSLQGISIVTVNYVITVCLVIFLIKLIEKNSLLTYLLYGKKV